ncbi:MAG TPA: hypothetical protein VFZ84_16305 [Burkholderiales bacterium]
MDTQSLPRVQMPNRDAFIVDDRPDAKAVRGALHDRLQVTRAGWRKTAGRVPAVFVSEGTGVS